MHVLLLATLAIGVAAHANAQAAPRATAAVAGGYSSTAGLIGVEYVRRAPLAGAPVGWAVGAGIAGAGARVNVALGAARRDSTTRGIPYLAIGALAMPWLPFANAYAAASAEIGMQFWPEQGRSIYFDGGAGTALIGERDGGTRTGFVLRALVGRAF